MSNSYSKPDAAFEPYPEDPPNKNDHVKEIFAARMAKVRSNPGVWFVIGEYTSSSSAGALRQRMLQVYKDYQYRVRWRKTDSLAKVYARYVEGGK